MEFLTCADAEREKEGERREREASEQSSRQALHGEEKMGASERASEREMVKAPLEWMLSRSEDEAPGAQGWLAGSAQVIARYYHNTFTANGRRKKLGA